jgi:CheY-like chemotaxis protein
MDTTGSQKVRRIRPSAGPDRPGAEAEPGEAQIILVVEDEEAIRNLIRQVLELRGYAVRTTGAVEEAIRICEETARRIDLLVTDVVLPGMSGFDLAARARGSRPGLKVLYMSGYAADEGLGAGGPDPGAAFLQKPFTPAGLQTKIRELLEEH